MPGKKIIKQARELKEQERTIKTTRKKARRPERRMEGRIIKKRKKLILRYKEHTDMAEEDTKKI